MYLVWILLPLYWYLLSGCHFSMYFCYPHSHFIPWILIFIIYGVWEARDYGYVPSGCVVSFLVHLFTLSNGCALNCYPVGVAYFIILILVSYLWCCTQYTWHLSHDGVADIITCAFWINFVAAFSTLSLWLLLINNLFFIFIIFWCSFVVILVIFYWFY